MDARILAVIGLMETALDRPLQVSDLARAVNLSPSRLIHLFTREIGVPPARYLRRRRLVRAYDRLTSSFQSVKEVMASVGFNDASHFSREFKRYHGVTPREVCRKRRVGRAPPPGELSGPAAETAIV